MSQENPAKVIPAPQGLRQKIGGRLGAIDPNAIAKAEAALKNLSSNFEQWLQEEMTKLEAARQGVRQEGPNSENLETLYLRAHDLKGLGTTYEFPLVTRLAGSLCRLLDDRENGSTPQMALVDAHIDAIRAAVRDNIRTDEHPLGKALAEELERRVSASVQP